jgi:NAD(P)H-hydrate epimerase
MKRLVTAKEMRDLDRRTIDEAGIKGRLLMEAASLAVAEAACEMLGSPAGKSITVFCGRGNNGGDGFAAARHLSQRGASVSVVLIGEPGALKGDALANFTLLSDGDVSVRIAGNKNDLRKDPDADLVIDALLGTGVSGEIEGLTADAVIRINRAGCPVLSVDMPSGVSSDTGRFGRVCVKAGRTVTFGELKRGLVLYPGRGMAGKVSVADIGIPGSVLSSAGITTFLAESRDAASRLPLRPAWAHKGTFGKVLVLAGSTGMTGAAALCSSSVLRAGAGMAMLGIPSSLNSILEQKLTEVMTQPLAQTDSGSLSLGSEKDIRTLSKWADVMAVGPGLSRHPETSELVRSVVLGTRLPLVIDADGINAFEGCAGLLENKNGPFILTPHSGELSRITGQSIESIERDRIDAARTASSRFRGVVLLKGAPAIAALTDGTVWVNSTGNSGMATAGAGDVLTGLIAGLLAQGLSPDDAALCGMFLHGLAGDLAASAKTERAMLAGDIVDFLGAAFFHLEPKA